MIHLERRHEIEGGTCCWPPTSRHVRTLPTGLRILQPHGRLVDRAAVRLPTVDQSRQPLVGWLFTMPSARADHRVERPSTGNGMAGVASGRADGQTHPDGRLWTGFSLRTSKVTILPGLPLHLIVA
jgi:hypothetical protein